MRPAVLTNPSQDRRIILQFVNHLFEGVWIDFQERQEMFVEADGLVVVAVEQPFAVQARLVDQTRQMDVITEPLVGAARKQFLHSPQTRRLPANRRDAVAGASLPPGHAVSSLQRPAAIPPAPTFFGQSPVGRKTFPLFPR